MVYVLEQLVFTLQSGAADHPRIVSGPPGLISMLHSLLLYYYYHFYFKDKEMEAWRSLVAHLIAFLGGSKIGF